MELPPPTKLTISEVFGALMGVPVAVEERDSAPRVPSNERIVCVFRTDEGECAVVVLSDLPLAASCGAALAMLPLESVEAAISERVLNEELVDNYREVLNVSGTLFNAPGARHLVMREYLVGETMPRDATRLFIRAQHKLHFTVEVEDYPAGNLSVLL